ncbi:potassium/proton antiporter [Neosynechococcus sphagnicola]|uniref:potassium/proton antiporter n=1 Tax=Neosynechococcus sphagnicola TaxID=1501145 RepID=UPI00068E48A8|nr:potassium/proton antiporter [Neosynechococcus sphagnicola]
MDNVPLVTAIVLIVIGVLLAVSSLASRVSSKLGVPTSLVFLGIGMLAGSDGLGGIWFDDFEIAYMFGTLAMVVILFSGGLNTPLPQIKSAIAPTLVLSTVGVLGMAVLTAVGAKVLGLSWPEALLVGAIVSSTDASAVFAVLQGVNLRKRVALTLELESGLNDPVAVILTVVMTANLTATESLNWTILPEMVQQLLIGVGIGGAMGYLGQLLLRRIPLSTGALVPVLSLGLALIAYGIATVADGSGMLAVYLAGMVIGNSPLPERQFLTGVHDSFAWLAQVGMFLLLGLLVFPSRLPEVAASGLFLAGYLAIAARPLVVTLCLLPFRFSWQETLYVSWVGLRGGCSDYFGNHSRIERCQI